MKNIKKIIDNIDFHKGSGMVPAIIQDEKTKAVVMLGYMNRESLRMTLESNVVWFYSRTKNKLWNKGESLGIFQYVKEIYLDHDSDTLLIIVNEENKNCENKNCSSFEKRIK